ncbi:MnhB domain-containing protein [Ectothiorhodospira lacustris]|uniref:MnhB domain-containing protein n=1 Tax=Ectothiorhodospira lacustris TaxID=2899127 RepID=UPI001EE7CE6B|nr:MnhB domain-containing protein [Ectothiorhodospira lacustris]MCG5501315.1 Na(+)/H(+) antiporter subunit B [Ectothiorhodospira lacustris]
MAAAIRAHVAQATFAAALGFIAYGLLLGLVWVRLGTVDVALTAATVGVMTGVLLLSAAARMRAGEQAAILERPGPALRGLIAVLCIAVSAAIALVVLMPADPAPTLAPAAAANNLHATGLGNPVTAVLMAYRAIDTLLVNVVLLIAVVAVWSMAPDSLWGGRPGPTPVRQDNEALTFLARLLPPIAVGVGIYLLWNDINEPGGAFQGGAILAAIWILARMAGLVDAPAIGRLSLRLALVSGPVVFLTAGFAGFALAEGFLAYPSGWERPVIIVINSAMTLTVAVTLAMLLEGPPTRPPSPPLAGMPTAQDAKRGER